MLSRQLFLLVLLISTLSLSGLSCGQKKASNGGVYKSTDGGETWEQKVKIDDKNSLAHLSVNRVVIDQENSQVIFAGTETQGIYQSVNGGETWQPTSLRSGLIRDLVFNPKDSTVLYAAGSMAGTGKIFKSADSGNNWEEVYAETHSGTEVNSVVVDWYDPRKVYAGTNVGALLKSTDSGRSWVAVQWFDQSVDKVVISYRDSRELYVQLASTIHQSINGAESFIDLKGSWESLGKVGNIHDLVVHPQGKETIYFISSLGLLKSGDRGKSWQSISLLSYPEFRSIVSLVLDPVAEQTIYFSYDSNLYKSVNGGQNWSVRQFTSGKIKSVAVDASDTAVIYAGVLTSGQ